MSDNTIFIEPLTAQAFAPFGQVIQTEGAQHFPINNGKTERFHDLAQVQLAGPNSRPIISIACGQPYSLPLTLAMVERHPFGSQAFHPLSNRPFLVIVAPDENGTPGRPRAFLTAPGQGINYAINTWHGVLTPLGNEPADFLLVDRAGDGPNLEEYFYPTPWQVVAAS